MRSAPGFVVLPRLLLIFSLDGSRSPDSFELMLLLRRERHRGIEASWVPMRPPMSAITGNCAQLQAAVTPSVIAPLADRIALFMAGLA